MFKTALDLGYGYVKGINEKGKQILFPSLVGNAYQRNFTGLFGQRFNHIIDNMHVVLNNGREKQEEYFIGELARREGRNVSYVFDEDKVNHPNTKALLASASALLFPEDEQPIHLVSGLPLEQYVHQRNEFKDMIKNFSAIVEFKGYDFLKAIKFDKVTIFPQAAGAVYYAIMDNLQKYFIKGSYIGLIDIGYKTTDYIVFVVDEKLSLREDLSGTFNIGMFVLNNAADKLFTQKTGSKLDISELMQLVSEGSIFYKGKVLNFEEELNEVKSEISRVIQDRIKAVWGNKLDFFNTIFFAGGGGLRLFESLKDVYENTVLVKNSQFANAKGFLKVAEIEEKKGN
ncbi:ParM/StbA family protein [Aceticella autotrophica]|uniref:ParM/StbA family protein n=1 Tax=Aceticella autotrophica TaxID=2755338 RepID=A0A975GAS4_9THEO|nr:ParM/StbA family protein [Aceticella autotrophica]QSZ27610.1 ParM/StbA family protein [Aceticella autotrophica]